MRQPTSRQIVAFFVLDMLPRVLVLVLATIALGFLYRRAVEPPTIAVWNVIVTLVVSVGLARVSGALLIATAASIVDGGPTSLTSEGSRNVAIGLASPNLTRFYLSRLALYFTLGTALGLLFILLNLFKSPRNDLFASFITGPMSGVLYGYLATGWELARTAVAVSPAGPRSA